MDGDRSVNDSGEIQLETARAGRQGELIWPPKSVAERLLSPVDPFRRALWISMR